MKRKLIYIMLIVNIISSLLMATVFAWFTIQDGGELEYNAYFNSRRLIETEANVSLYDNSTLTLVNYNTSALFDKATNSVKVKEYFTNTSRYSGPLKFELKIKPLADIQLRVYIIEQWTDLDGNLINRQFEPIYSINTNSFTFDAISGSYIYNGILEKNNTAILIPFINNVSLPSGQSLGTNDLKISLYIEARQANTPGNWTSRSTNVSGAIENIDMIFEDITNQFYLRGVVVKIVHGDNPNNVRYFVYTENNKNQNISGIGSSTNPHKISVFLPETIDFSFDKNTNRVKIKTKYNVTASFIGNHDFAYSPILVQEYSPNNSYVRGDIVLYNGTYYIATSESTAGWNSMVSSEYVWIPLGSIYQGNRNYPINTVVYYEETSLYYLKLVDWLGPITSDIHWKIVGNYWAQKQTYYYGDLVEFDVVENGVTVRKIYQGINKNSGGFSHNGPGAVYNWRPFSNTIDHVSGQTYFKDDYAYNPSTDKYYRTISAETTASLTTTWAWQELTVKEWLPATSFTANNMTIYENKPYAWVGPNNTTNTEEPGTSANWVSMSREWHEFNTYKVGDSVYYQGNLYTYNGMAASSGVEPGNEGWELFSINWHQYNQYSFNDVVFHNGGVWRALVSTYGSAPGLDFSIWEEVVLEWRPDRDAPPFID